MVLWAKAFTEYSRPLPLPERPLRLRQRLSLSLSSNSSLTTSAQKSNGASAFAAWSPASHSRHHAPTMSPRTIRSRASVSCSALIARHTGAALLLLRLGVVRLLVNGVFVLAQGQARADDEVRERRALGENYAHVVDERGVVRVVRGVHVEPARDVEVRETRERAEVREDHARGDELRGGVTRRLQSRSTKLPKVKWVWRVMRRMGSERGRLRK